MQSERRRPRGRGTSPLVLPMTEPKAESQGWAQLCTGLSPFRAARPGSPARCPWGRAGTADLPASTAGITSARGGASEQGPAPISAWFRFNSLLSASAGRGGCPAHRARPSQLSPPPDTSSTSQIRERRPGGQVPESQCHQAGLTPAYLTQSPCPPLRWPVPAAALG